MVPTDGSKPGSKPPGQSANASSEAGAAFASWYTKWLIYGYVARSSKPLRLYADECPQCDVAADQIDDAVASDIHFEGSLTKTLIVQTSNLRSTRMDVAVKWQSAGFTLVKPDGQTSRQFDGGSGVYIITLVRAKGQGWRVHQIAIVS